MKSKSFEVNDLVLFLFIICLLMFGVVAYDLIYKHGEGDGYNDCRAFLYSCVNSSEEHHNFYYASIDNDWYGGDKFQIDDHFQTCLLYVYKNKTEGLK